MGFLEEYADKMKAKQAAKYKSMGMSDGIRENTPKPGITPYNGQGLRAAPIYSKLKLILPPHPATGQQQPLIQHLANKPTGTMPDYYSTNQYNEDTHPPGVQRRYLPNQYNPLDPANRYPNQYNKDTNPTGVIY